MASPRSTPQSNPTQALKCRGPSLSHPRLSVALLNWGPTGMGCLISRLSLEPSSLKSGFNGGGTNQVVAFLLRSREAAPLTSPFSQNSRVSVAQNSPVDPETERARS